MNQLPFLQSIPILLFLVLNPRAFLLLVHLRLAVLPTSITTASPSLIPTKSFKSPTIHPTVAQSAAIVSKTAITPFTAAIILLAVFICTIFCFIYCTSDDTEYIISKMEALFKLRMHHVKVLSLPRKSYNYASDTVMTMQAGTKFIASTSTRCSSRCVTPIPKVIPDDIETALRAEVEVVNEKVDDSLDIIDYNPFRSRKPSLNNKTLYEQELELDYDVEKELNLITIITGMKITCNPFLF